MLLKTIKIPSEYASYAALLYDLLLSPPPFHWELSCPSSPTSTSQGLTVPQPRLILRPDPSRASETPPWLLHFDRLDLTASPVLSLHRLDSLSLGGTRVKLLRSLSTETIRSDQVRIGVLPIPEISVEVAGLPDPIAYALTAVPGQTAFTLHLRTRLTSARFDVRLTY